MAQDDPNYPVSTASVSWVDSGGTIHIRVYSCDGYTAIERAWDGSQWTTGGFKAAASAVSATSWAPATIRVYCTFEDKTVEYCSDAGGAWYQGGYTTE